MKIFLGVWGAVLAVVLGVMLHANRNAIAAALQNAAVLRSLENSKVAVYFNPKEITIDKPVPWQKHKSSSGDEPTLEFTSAEPKTLSAELFFDTYESQQDVYDTLVAPLEVLADVDEDTGRPPLVSLTWGRHDFTGVIESVGVKYTMFMGDGTPVRATVNLKMKQASKVMKSKNRGAAPNDCP